MHLIILFQTISVNVARLFFYYLIKYFKTHKHVLLLSVILAMVTLIRPINIIVVLAIPIAARNSETLKNGLLNLFSNKLKLFYGIIIFSLIISIQLIIYKIQCGEFFVYSYTDEGFDFLNPHFFDILFSYKKGLFLYTPIVFVSVLSIIYFIRTDLYFVSYFTVFFTIVVYLLSSWWIWWYGGSFSGRPFVEFYPFLLLPLALILEKLQNKITKRVLISTILILTLFSQFQTYQYRYYIIHWEDMNMEKYWDAFFQLPF